MHKSIIITTLLVLICQISFASDPAKCFVENKNIFVAFTDGSTKQLTFNGSDKNPILLQNEKVFFVREYTMQGHNGEYLRHEIMTVDVNSLIEEVLSDQKPYQDGLDGTYLILRVEDLTLSLDGKYVYFITEKYATGNQLVKIDVNTGKWVELFTVESYELIKKGNFKGHFFVGQSLIKSKGRDVYYSIVDESGKALKEFEDLDALMSFRAKFVN